MRSGRFIDNVSPIRQSLRTQRAVPGPQPALGSAAAWARIPLGPHPERSRRIKGRASRALASSFDFAQDEAKPQHQKPDRRLASGDKRLGALRSNAA